MSTMMVLLTWPSSLSSWVILAVVVVVNVGDMVGVVVVVDDVVVVAVIVNAVVVVLVVDVVVCEVVAVDEVVSPMMWRLTASERVCNRKGTTGVLTLYSHEHYVGFYLALAHKSKGKVGGSGSGTYVKFNLWE